MMSVPLGEWWAGEFCKAMQYDGGGETVKYKNTRNSSIVCRVWRLLRGVRGRNMCLTGSGRSLSLQLLGFRINSSLYVSRYVFG